MENKTVTLSRHLALVALVNQRPGISVADLAAKLGCSPRQVKGDVLLLDRAGFGDLLPGQTFDFDLERLETKGEVQLFAPLGVTGPPPLTRQETLSLVAGLGVLGARGSEADQMAITRLLPAVLKLGEKHVSPGTVTKVLQVLDPDGEGESISLVRKAIDNERQLQIKYLSARGRASARLIDPLSLTQTADGWVVRAWCHLAEEERHFRLDRFLENSYVDEPQNHPPLTRRSGTAKRCEVTLTAAAKWLAGELPATVRTTRDGDLTAKFEVLDEQWMVNQIVYLAPYVLDAEPRKYLEMAAKQARAALAEWGDVEA